MEEVYLNLKKMKKTKKTTKARTMVDIKNEWTRVAGISISVSSELPMLFPAHVVKEDIEKVFPEIIDWKVTKMVDVEIKII